MSSRGGRCAQYKVRLYSAQPDRGSDIVRRKARAERNSNCAKTLFLSFAGLSRGLAEQLLFKQSAPHRFSSLISRCIASAGVLTGDPIGFAARTILTTVARALKEGSRSAVQSCRFESQGSWNAPQQTLDGLAKCALGEEDEGPFGGVVEDRRGKSARRRERRGLSRCKSQVDKQDTLLRR